MKIVKDENSGMHELHFGKENLAYITNEWVQFKGNWNWIDFNFISVHFMKDEVIKGYEFDFILLGIGIHIRLNGEYEPTNEDAVTAHKTIKEFFSKNKETN